MENLPARVPHTLFPDLVSAFVPPDTPPDAVLELVITIADENIPVREFADYLALMDRVYGRMSPEGLMSYAHRGRGRLHITKVNNGSLQSILEFLQEHADKAIVLYLLLKNLPNVIKTSAEAFKTYQEGRSIREDTRHKEITHRYEEVRLARENRRHIREVIQQEIALVNLDDARKDQLTRLLEALLMEENPRLSTPIRFARTRVISVTIKIKDKSQPEIDSTGERAFLFDEEE